jgi:flagellar L-ring protein precursor FlgH
MKTMLLGICLSSVVACAQADSLYKRESFKSLTSDRKAAVVGDVLTVQVVENTSATTTADTATRRSSGARLGFGSTRGSSLHAELDARGDFDGGGSTRRANRFQTALTVSVREVLPNGDLRVEGQQVLSLNDEQQTVRVEGRVRRMDISEGNIVLSSRLADARITLVGDGDLTERQRRSWWKQAMDWMGL